MIEVYWWGLHLRYHKEDLGTEVKQPYLSRVKLIDIFVVKQNVNPFQGIVEVVFN